MHREKILKYKLCIVVDPSKKVPELNCEVEDLLLEVVDLKQEQWRINHDANDAMAWGPPLKGAPRAAV